MSEQALMKDRLGSKAVEEISDALSKVITDFPAEQFNSAANLGLDKLELKQRVSHIVYVLAQFLPQDFIESTEILLALKQYYLQRDQQQGWFSFSAWPVIDYVGQYGLEHPQRALTVLAELTALFSAEFAIRPYIEHHYQLSYNYCLEWTQSPNEHVRRLASEGLRPSLPWAKNIDVLLGEPSELFNVLARLKDDKSLYVRKSVANNLNDISKRYPSQVVELCEGWTNSATPECQWIIKRALRTLLKSGHQKAFELLAYSIDPAISVQSFQTSSSTITLGEDIHFSIDLASHSSKQQKLMIDYKVYFVGANSKTRSKVFKWKELVLDAGGAICLDKKHSFKVLSTRKYYSGLHHIELMINGKAYQRVSFTLIE